MSGPFDGTVVWLTWRQLFARRRIYIAAAFALLPVLFTVFFKLGTDDQAEGRMAFFNGLSRELVIGTLVPLAAALFGTTAFGGEVDDGTLVYLLIKPIARWRIVLSKYLVAMMSTVAVMIPALLLPWLVLSGPELSASALIGYLVGGAAGAAIYCALFLSLGLASRRALVIALIYLIGFEAVLSRNLIGVKSLSVREFAVALSRAASNGTIVIKSYVVPMTTVWIMSALLLIGALALTQRRLSRFELAERV